MFNKMIYPPSQYFKSDTRGEADSGTSLTRDLLQDLNNIMYSSNGVGLRIWSTKLHIY